MVSPGPLQNQSTDTLTVTVPDLGQGDAILVQPPNGRGGIGTRSIATRPAIGKQSPAGD